MLHYFYDVPLNARTMSKGTSSMQLGLQLNVTFLENSDKLCRFIKNSGSQLVHNLPTLNFEFECLWQQRQSTQTFFPFSSYNIVYFILTYLVPIVAMGICYGRIGRALWGKGIIRENACVDLAQQRKLMSKRKVSTHHIKMLHT